MKMKKDKHGRYWFSCAVTQTRTGNIAVTAFSHEEARQKVEDGNYGSSQEDCNWDEAQMKIHEVMHMHDFTEEANNE